MAQQTINQEILTQLAQLKNIIETTQSKKTQSIIDNLNINMEKADSFFNQLKNNDPWLAHIKLLEFIRTHEKKEVDKIALKTKLTALVWWFDLILRYGLIPYLFTYTLIPLKTPFFVFYSNNYTLHQTLQQINPNFEQITYFCTKNVHNNQTFNPTTPIDWTFIVQLFTDLLNQYQQWNVKIDNIIKEKLKKEYDYDQKASK